MGGYAGQILHVDLTSGSIDKKPLDMNFARSHIGGLGFITRIYPDLIKEHPDVDALSPENPFILMTGPLTGMKLNGAARWTVGTRSPLTGFWGDSNTGGFFGAYLKFAGYDGIIITGKAEKPVYLYINNDVVEIRDAAEYWGADVFDTTDRMTADLKIAGQRSGQVLCIGPAGENMTRFASLINNKGHAAGRTGMGAVWGSKNLKAVYVVGTGKLDIADPEALKSIKEELKTVYEESIFIDALHASGTRPTLMSALSAAISRSRTGSRVNGKGSMTSDRPPLKRRFMPVTVPATAAGLRVKKMPRSKTAPLKRPKDRALNTRPLRPLAPCA